MPTQTVLSALVQAYSNGGAPWNWDTWKSITNVHHGLFPSDDSLLPHRWSRKNATDVQSFLKECADISSDVERDKFVKSSQNPGRNFLHQWVSSNYERWDIHNKVVSCLKEADVHPLHIMTRENSLTWPNSNLYLGRALDSIAWDLFGPDAFPDGTNVLPAKWNFLASAIGLRSWVRIRGKVKWDLNRISQMEEAATLAFNEIKAEPQPTKAAVVKTLRAVAKWKDLVEIYSVTENQEKADSMVSDLKDLLAALGAKVPKEKGTRRIKGPSQRVSKEQLSSIHRMASEEDISELTNLWNDYFDSSGVRDEVTPPEPSELSINMRDVDNGALGMEVEALLTPDELSELLGFRKGLPYLFNTLRHDGGITPWDSPSDFAVNPSQPLRNSFQPLSLHWHQLAGISSIIRNTFTADRKKHTTNGMLIADEVGLGKTTQCLATIAFLNQAIFLREKGSPPPPILKTYKYLQSREDFEALPHLIVVPGTLRAQWVQEIRTLFKPNSVDILIYDCGKSGNSSFWGPSGPFQASKQPRQNIIVLTTHTSIRHDFQKVYGPLPKKRKHPWDMPELRRGAQVPDTIFGTRFLSVAIDEAHEFRKEGVKHLAALRLTQQASLKLILTGTPLHTSHKDIVSLARLVGVPHFFTEDSLDQGRQDASDLSRAKKQDSKATEEEVLSGLLALPKVQVEVVRRMQTQVKPNILRRTTDTRNWAGNSLLNLPPHRDIIGVLNLTARELKIIEERAEASKMNANTENESGFVTTNFYIDYRKDVGYAKENPDAPNPTFKTLEEWEEKKSTKMDCLAKVVRHYLSHDNIADVQFVDGAPIFPPPPSVPLSQSSPRNRKIVIYAAFPSMTPILLNVLNLYGIDCLHIDGQTPLDKRAAIVDKFNDPNGPRVFIFSSVGGTGLNLSAADIVIFFDQTWSSQDERQIRGRAHRQPQRKVVIVIHLLANDTTDILMNNMASQKRDMFEAFVNKDMGKDLQSLLSSRTVHDAEPLDQPDVEDGLEFKSKRRTSRRLKKDKEGVSVSKKAEEGRSGPADGADATMTSRSKAATTRATTSAPTTDASSANHTDKAISKGTSTAIATAAATAATNATTTATTATTSTTTTGVEMDMEMDGEWSMRGEQGDKSGLSSDGDMDLFGAISDQDYASSEGGHGITQDGDEEPAGLVQAMGSSRVDEDDDLFGSSASPPRHKAIIYPPNTETVDGPLYENLVPYSSSPAPESPVSEQPAEPAQRTKLPQMGNSRAATTRQLSTTQKRLKEFQRKLLASAEEPMEAQPGPSNLAMITKTTSPSTSTERSTQHERTSKKKRKQNDTVSPNSALRESKRLTIATPGSITGSNSKSSAKSDLNIAGSSYSQMTHSESCGKADATSRPLLVRNPMMDARRVSESMRVGASGPTRAHVLGASGARQNALSHRPQDLQKRRGLPYNIPSYRKSSKVLEEDVDLDLDDEDIGTSKGLNDYRRK
ncbi:hypothetical protein E1B28_006856 [Marasmius oreades]|uniref:Uncharacterized protein n=1 Tax=Marasmius oreades TaxID=181124 RepID=A0A9P7USU6_9AGAR|nr:uncharacterized protein E1B28_006856 [Marasmius oreades]KAG7093167.1 hypothetical protein E1B28_006856 [Marasmius oreades]